MKIAVIGATGFVGSAILKEALRRKENEAGILLAIANGIRTDELVKKFGLF